jgi:hypothetical protein
MKVRKLHLRTRQAHAHTKPTQQVVPAKEVKQRVIGELVADMRHHQAQIARLKEQIIAVAPFKVGDTIEINYGGSLGKQMLVGTVEVEEVPDAGWQLVAQGAALTADGKPGSRRGIHIHPLP